MNEEAKRIVRFKLVEIAAGEVGVKEEGGNNVGARIQEFQRSTWLATGPWPWCAAFTCWVLDRWLDLPEVREWYGATRSKDYDEWRCKDAEAYGWERWARKHGELILTEKNRAMAGDFVVFDFPHIGIVREDQPVWSGSIKTIEGNTNAAGTRDSGAKPGDEVLTTDGVWRKIRKQGLTRCYIRLVF